MDDNELIQYFQASCADHSETCAAIKALINFISRSKAGTMVQLRDDIRTAMATLSEQPGPTASIVSGLQLFLHCITLTTLDHPDFGDTTRVMVERGTRFLNVLSNCRENIGRKANRFITSGMKILTHSRSRTVLQVLKQAAESNKKFTVYVTESMPDKSGEVMHRELVEAGIDSVLITDSSVGYMMERVDMVLVGAEGVVESGGIINKVGTYTMALAAKAEKKPFYVVSEWFKFNRIFPLNQQDIPTKYKYSAADIASGQDLSRLSPRVDYTPPSYIDLLFTDMGVLTPAAVSDRLIELYL